jgi:putative membrane protein
VKIVIYFVALAVAFAVTAAISPGIEITGGPLTWVGIAVVFAVVNVVLGTIVRLLSLPLILLTLGLFALVINGALLLITDNILDSFTVDDLWSAIIGSMLISLITMAVQWVLERPAARAA